MHYVEPYTVSRDHRREIARELYQNGPMKPWTLLNRVSAPHKVLKQMTLNGEIDVNANADIYLTKRDLSV